MNPAPPLAEHPLYTRPFTIAIISQMGFVMANLFMTHYARWIDFLGGDVRDAGLIMGLSATGALLTRPWLGQWLNRIGARNMWAIGCGFFLIGVLGNYYVTNLGWLIYFLRTCQLIGVACVSSSSLTYVSQIAPPHRQTEAIGILGVGGFLGFIFGPYLGDVILDQDHLRESYILLFAVSGTILGSSTVLLWLLPQQAPTPRRAVTLSDFVRTVIAYWPGPALGVMAVFGMCMTVPLIFLAKYVKDTHLTLPGMSVFGLYFFVYASSGLFMRIGLRRVPEIVGNSAVLFFGSLAMSAGMLSFLLINPERVWWLVLPALLCGTGHGLMFHTATAQVLRSFPPEVRGTGSALSFMMFDIGLLIGGPLFGTVAEQFGYFWMFALVGGICGCTGVGYITLVGFAREQIHKPVIESVEDSRTATPVCSPQCE